MPRHQLWRQLRAYRGRIGPFDQPAFRIAVGVLCIATAVLMTLFGSSVTNGWNAPFVGWYLFVLVVGIGCLGSGFAQLRRREVLEVEMRRAQAEWHALQDAVTAAEAQGRNVVRVLLDRGYREFEVRRWILHRLGHAQAVAPHR